MCILIIGCEFLSRVVKNDIKVLKMIVKTVKIRKYNTILVKK